MADVLDTNQLRDALRFKLTLSHAETMALLDSHDSLRVERDRLQEALKGIAKNGSPGIIEMVRAALGGTQETNE